MQIQQPNVASFARADYKFLQQMSDNDDTIKNNLEMTAKGVIALGICNNLQLKNASPNYSNSLGVYQSYSSVDWIDVNFTQPNSTRLTANFESNRFYKFILHFDYVWAANTSTSMTSTGGRTGRIEVRVRDITHRHDLIYWTNYVDPDYNMGGFSGAYYYIRDTSNKPDYSIWQWADESAKGSVPSSCHATRVLPAKTSGNAIIKVQYRPMNAYGGVLPPKLMDCSGGQPMTNLPSQYKNASTTYNTEPISQFNGYLAVEDCGPVEKPAGVEQGVLDDNSISPLFEAYENSAYDGNNTGKP